mmetsp:Transcript_24051/g.26710  ORF Transcript_24051/g.26710 Transcript_24051/m.26710 type:complete len:124 (+) Transcript_24051:220-591(+)
MKKERKRIGIKTQMEKKIQENVVNHNKIDPLSRVYNRSKPENIAKIAKIYQVPKMEEEKKTKLEQKNFSIPKNHLSPILTSKPFVFENSKKAELGEKRNLDSIDLEIQTDAQGEETQSSKDKP